MEERLSRGLRKRRVGFICVEDVVLDRKNPKTRESGRFFLSIVREPLPHGGKVLVSSTVRKAISRRNEKFPVATDGGVPTVLGIHVSIVECGRTLRDLPDEDC